jgi:hypothetical protein
MKSQTKFLNRIAMIWIYIILVISLLFGIQYLYHGIISGGMFFLNILFVLLIVMWKKIGVYGLYLTAVFFTISASAVEQVPYTLSLPIFIGPLVLTYLIRNQWDLFE